MLCFAASSRTLLKDSCRRLIPKVIHSNIHRSIHRSIPVRPLVHSPSASTVADISALRNGFSAGAATLGRCPTIGKYHEIQWPPFLHAFRACSSRGRLVGRRTRMHYGAVETVHFAVASQLAVRVGAGPGQGQSLVPIDAQAPGRRQD